MDLAQNFNEELISIYLKLFYKIEREEILPNSFSKARVILILKPHKEPTKKELRANFPYE